MKMNRPFALLGAAVLVAPWAGADDSVLVARQDLGAEVELSDAAEAGPALAVVTNSRGVPIVPATRQAAPSARPAAPAISRPGTGAIVRSTISEVIQDSSHIVVTDDTTPVHYRYTKATQFIDEEGRVLSADAVKSGTKATLHYTRTEGDLVLTKVIVIGVSRPLLGGHTQALTEVTFER